jgi:hypothetical protein
MTKISAGDCMDLYNTQAAGELLQSQLQEHEGYWQQFLTNNRRADRTPPYRIPFTRLGKAALYSREELAKFLAWEKSRRIGEIKLTGRAAEIIHMYGIGQSGGSNHGRELSYNVTFQFDEVRREFYIAMQIDEPLLMFKLPMTQAKNLRDDLSELIDTSERVARETLK